LLAGVPSLCAATPDTGGASGDGGRRGKRDGRGWTARQGSVCSWAHKCTPPHPLSTKCTHRHPPTCRLPPVLDGTRGPRFNQRLPCTLCRPASPTRQKHDDVGSGGRGGSGGRKAGRRLLLLCVGCGELPARVIPCTGIIKHIRSSAHSHKQACTCMGGWSCVAPCSCIKVLRDVQMQPNAGHLVPGPAHLPTLYARSSTAAAGSM
jgi:hypothetical protein